MTLLALIRKGGLAKVATATPATVATEGAEGAGTVAAVASVAVANPPAPERESPKSTPAAPMTAEEEAAIRAWMAHIEETNPAIIAEALDQCRADTEALAYFLHRAEEVPRPLDFDDDRRHCADCANLTPSGLCLAAQRGEITASRTYQPVDHIPRRCEGYAPGADDPDRRPGSERWPNLHQKRDNHADD